MALDASTQVDGHHRDIAEATAAPVVGGATAHRGRIVWLDNLKGVLVAGVIVGHATIAWTGYGNWVTFESPVREPLLSILLMVMLIGALVAMPLFFFIAGAFTPPSLRRKGLRRFLADRLVRLGLPMLFFVIFLAPLIEYVDADNVGWDKGFLAFAPTTWWPWPPAWGPTWFLAVLLLFSTIYAVARTAMPNRRSGPLRARHLLGVGVVVALITYAVRFAVPLGEERWHLALGQAPAWVGGFLLGVAVAERDWFRRPAPVFLRRLRRTAWTAITATVLVLAVAMSTGASVAAFGGGGTWQSLVTALLEAALVASVPFWVVDLFRRRWNRQGRLSQVLSRAAFAAFVLHQLVLVGFVLLSRHVAWPPELEYAAVSALAVVGSFALAAALVRIPGVRRVV
jgi:glucan biosynthesis protein C